MDSTPLNGKCSSLAQALCLSIVAFVSLSACFASEDNGLANGLNGYWTFDEMSGETLHDISGNGRDGSLVNFPDGQGNWSSGQIGGSLLFGGPSTDQYVTVPDFDMPTTSMTLTAWIWANSTPRWATIASNWNGAWGAFNYATFGTARDYLSLYVADAHVDQGGINVTYGTSGPKLSLGQWHFVAFVADEQSDLITFMQDGVFGNAFGYRGQLLASSSQLNIGDNPSDTYPDQGNWDGKIDDLAIWSRALDYQELESIYNAGLTGQPLSTQIPEPSVMGMFILGILMISSIRFARIL